MYEAAELLGVSRPGLHARMQKDERFPEPIARLRCGPIWERRQFVEYAQRRTAAFVERPAVVALAREVPAAPAGRVVETVSADDLGPAEAARLIGAAVGDILYLGYRCPGATITDGVVTSIRRDALGALARVLGRRYAAPVEERS